MLTHLFHLSFYPFNYLTNLLYIPHEKWTCLLKQHPAVNQPFSYGPFEFCKSRALFS